MFWYGNWSWGAWLLMTLGMVAFWGLVIWAIVSLVRSGPSAPTAERPSAEQILAERFARGEIDGDEYHRRLDALRSPTTPLR